MSIKTYLCFILLTAVLAGCEYDWSREGSINKRMIIVDTALTEPQVQFAVGEILTALKERGYPAQILMMEEERVKFSENTFITLKIDSSIGLRPQGYRIRVTNNEVLQPQFEITGADAIGAMYGGLQLAEAIRIEKTLETITPSQEEPHIIRRGIKISVPLDARTPGYDDTGDSAVANYAQMWEFDFWRRFLDAMARHRYNTLTLWNPHPFPSMVRVSEYPKAALEDVYKPGVKPTGKPGEWNEPLLSKTVSDNLLIVKRMTMDEKIDHWRKVMKYAQDRGIDIYFLTWNICMNSMMPPFEYDQRNNQHNLKGKYGISNSLSNAETSRYLRACVRDFILTYPLLAGIGTVPGENMDGGIEEKEQWLWQTYGLGVVDAKRADPTRNIKFIHFCRDMSVQNVMDIWQDYPEEDVFELGFDYAPRLYSDPDPPLGRSWAEEMKPYRLRGWWNLSNEDIFIHRWGDPEYVRQFIMNFPQARTAGYTIGSNGYVWGKEFVSLDLDRTADLEIDKHWYSFMLWGRLGYNPQLDRAFFEKVLSHRLESGDSSLLYDAWAASSRIVPLVNRFHWRSRDSMWTAEGCIGENGFHTIKEFINPGPDPGTAEDSGIMSIPEYVRAVSGGETTTQKTPLMIADELDENAKTALDNLRKIKTGSALSIELQETISDIESMSWLGKYYAAKIRGAVAYAMFERNGDSAHRETAEALLRQASEAWHSYARKMAGRYRSQVLARTGKMDWWAIWEETQKDLQIVSEKTAVQIQNPPGLYIP